MPLPCSKDCSLPFILWGQQAHWFIPWGQPCAAGCLEQSPPTGWSTGWSPCLSRQRTICEFLRRENLYWSFWTKQFLGIILCSSSPMSWRAGLRFAEKSNFILGSSSPALVISIFWKISSKSNEAKVRSSSSNAALPSWLGLGEKRSCLIVKKVFWKRQSPHEEHVSLRDLLVELVVLIREAEDFQGVVLVVREVQLHRHVCHLRQRDDISGGASLILGKCMNVLVHIQNVLVILF